MTGTTTGETTLATATDSDDIESFATSALTTDLQAIANKFDHTTGHDHSAAGGGKAIGSAGLAANAVTQAGQGRGSGVTTTTSASYVDLGDMTVALTTTGGDLLCWMIVSVSNNAAGNAVDVAFKLDAATEVGDMRVSAPVANYDVVTKAIWRFTGVSAASHTVQGRWRTTAGTASADSVYRTMIVMEVKR